MKTVFRIIFLLFSLYAVVWSYYNVDFNSIIKDTKGLVQYEFDKDNFETSIESFVNMIQKRIP